MIQFQSILQILILSVGIYVFLRFVQTTRGSRLVRGLVISTLVIAVGLFLLTRALELEELGHILGKATGFFVVLLAVLFQPELRHGIAQLGEGSFVGRLIRRLSRDTVNEIVQAVQSMAARRQGALIAIECDSSLDNYIEGGVKVDANVHRLLLESIFHPGGTLHDGAVVIRKDRIAAAACLFPLTENIQIARSTGTRHRAALGLADETDAVAVAVSEETGQVSLARRGRLHGVPPNRLEQELRTALGDERTGAEERAPESPWRRWPLALFDFLRRDWLWLGASVLLATGVFLTARNELSSSQEYSLRIATASEKTEAGPGELVVVLPSDDYRVVSVAPNRFPTLVASGTRAQIEKLGLNLAGVLEVTDPEQGRVEIDLDDVRWRSDVFGVSYEWVDERPTIELLRFSSRRFRLGVELVEVDDSERDPHYEVRREGITLDPSAAEIEGPVELLDELEATGALRLEPIRLGEQQSRDYVGPVRLAQELREQHLSIVEPGGVTVTVPLYPAARQLGLLTREVPLICTRAERSDELERWAIPSHAQTARFSVHVSGLIPPQAEPDSQIVSERTSAIMRYVDEHLTVFADVSDLPPAGEGRSVPVRYILLGDWRSDLAYLRGSLGARDELRVRIESEEEILLEERRAGGDDSTGNDEGT